MKWFFLLIAGLGILYVVLSQSADSGNRGHSSADTSAASNAAGNAGLAARASAENVSAPQNHNTEESRRRTERVIDTIRSAYDAWTNLQASYEIGFNFSEFGRQFSSLTAASYRLDDLGESAVPDDIEQSVSNFRKSLKRAISSYGYAKQAWSIKIQNADSAAMGAMADPQIRNCLQQDSDGYRLAKSIWRTLDNR